MYKEASKDWWKIVCLKIWRMIMLYLGDILYEIEESEIWSFNYNIMKGTIYLSIVNPYTAVRHEMKIEKNIQYFLCA